MKRRKQELGPILGAKPSLRERMVRSFSLKRGMFLGLLAIPVIPFYAVLKTGDLSTYISPEAWLVSAIMSPVVFIVGCFTDNVGI